METVEYSDTIKFPEELKGYQDKIDSYLRKNGYIDEIPDDIFRRQKLRDIISFERVNIDMYDMQRSKGKIESEEYLKKLGEAGSNVFRAREFLNLIYLARKYQKLEKKEQIKQKILSIFKK